MEVYMTTADKFSKYYNNYELYERVEHLVSTVANKYNIDEHPNLYIVRELDFNKLGEVKISTCNNEFLCFLYLTDFAIDLADVNQLINIIHHELLHCQCSHRLFDALGQPYIELESGNLNNLEDYETYRGLIFYNEFYAYKNSYCSVPHTDQNNFKANVNHITSKADVGMNYLSNALSNNKMSIYVARVAFPEVLNYLYIVAKSIGYFYASKDNQYLNCLQSNRTLSAWIEHTIMLVLKIDSEHNCSLFQFHQLGKHLISILHTKQIDLYSFTDGEPSFVLM